MQADAAGLLPSTTPATLAGNWLPPTTASLELCDVAAMQRRRASKESVTVGYHRACPCFNTVAGDDVGRSSIATRSTQIIDGTATRHDGGGCAW